MVPENRTFFCKTIETALRRAIFLVFPDVNPADQQLAAGDVIQPRNQLNKGRLGTAGAADDADGFAGLAIDRLIC